MFDVNCCLGSRKQRDEVLLSEILIDLRKDRDRVGFSDGNKCGYQRSLPTDFNSLT